VRTTIISLCLGKQHDITLPGIRLLHIIVVDPLDKVLESALLKDAHEVRGESLSSGGRDLIITIRADRQTGNDMSTVEEHINSKKRSRMLTLLMIPLRVT
jgi:hypothetical protein